MLDSLIRTVTPELVTHAIKSNPVATIEALQKFPTFQLLGSALTLEQQMALSNNVYLVNDFLGCPEGKTSVSLWAEEFVKYINKRKSGVPKETREQIEARITKELEDKYAKESIEAAHDLETRIRAELEAKFKADYEARSKVD